MSNARRSAKRRGRPRPAFLLVSVLICLSLAMALWAVRTRTLLRERRVLVSQQQALQCEYLAEAAIARAKAQLAADPAFRGETWQLDAEQLGGLGTGSVAISIAEQPGEPRVYQLKAVATLLARGTQTQRTRDVLFQATSSGEQP